jgi:hypothetical protein
VKRSHKIVFFFIWVVVLATFLFSILQFVNLRPRSAPSGANSGTNQSPRTPPSGTN